jgi:hypothetical protein
VKHIHCSFFCLLPFGAFYPLFFICLFIFNKKYFLTHFFYYRLLSFRHRMTSNCLLQATALVLAGKHLVIIISLPLCMLRPNFSSFIGTANKFAQMASAIFLYIPCSQWPLSMQHFTANLLELIALCTVSHFVKVLSNS